MTSQNEKIHALAKLNVDKCHVLTIGLVENISRTERCVNGEELDHFLQKKDLVITDHELTFKQHISSNVMKANVIMGSTRRSFTFFLTNNFRKLFITFVRPNLEYAQAVWAPHVLKYANMLEKVRERATRLVDGCSSTPTA